MIHVIYSDHALFLKMIFARTHNAFFKPSFTAHDPYGKNRLLTRKCRTLWGRAWASWQNIDEWCNIFNIRCSVQVDTMEPSLTPRRWIYWMRQTPHRVRRLSIKPSLPYLGLLWSPSFLFPFRVGSAVSLQTQSVSRTQKIHLHWVTRWGVLCRIQ